MSDTDRIRVIVYKQCRYHKRLDGETAERVCEDCRRLTFRATMRARGITVTIPTYKGGYPSTYHGGRHYTDGKLFDDSPGLRAPGVFAFPERIPGARHVCIGCDFPCHIREEETSK